MKTYISLLRGTNVSAKNRISMPELKRLYESMGLKDVVTYIQSGNVVFDCEENDPIKLTGIIENGIIQSIGSEVRVILRDKDGIKRIKENNPFVKQRNEDTGKLYVTFLSDVPGETSLSDIDATTDGGRSGLKRNSIKSLEGDEFMIYDKEVYLFCPNGYGKTKFSNTYFEIK
jgi:uncharacterized protein (DUF1697 family)